MSEPRWPRALVPVACALLVVIPAVLAAQTPPAPPGKQGLATSPDAPSGGFFLPAVTAEYLDSDGDVIRRSNAVVIAAGLVAPASSLRNVHEIRLVGRDGYEGRIEKIVALKIDVDLALLQMEEVPEFAIEVSSDPSYRSGMELLLVRGPEGDGPEWMTTTVAEKFSLRGPDFLALQQSLPGAAAAYRQDGTLFGLAFRLDDGDRSFPYLVTTVSLQNLVTGRGDAVELEDLALPADAGFRDGSTLEGLIFRGALLTTAGRTEDARSYVGLASKLSPDSPLTHFWLGKINFADKEWKDSADEFWYAAQADSTWHLAWHMCGAALHQGNAYSDAIRMYQRALQADPNSALTYSNLGGTYYASGDFDEAIRSFERAIEIEPGMGIAYFNLGRTYQKQGKLVEAEEVYLRLRERSEVWAQNLRKALDSPPAGE